MGVERYYTEADDAYLVLRMIDRISSATPLKPLKKAEIEETVDLIRTLHGKAYDWDVKVSTKELMTMTNHGFVLRTRLRSAIEYLDQLYQYGSLGSNEVQKLDTGTLSEDDSSSLDCLLS